MIYVVSRTSLCNYTKKPCEESFQTKDEFWSVEINSLEDLMDFVNKHGDIVVSNAGVEVGIHQIEIYDDYRE